jgi:hypothetical protein
MNRRTLLCALAICACAPAWAQINKCVDARGRVSYQEQPCPGARIERVSPSPQAAEPAATPQQPQGEAAGEREQRRRRECAQGFEQLSESWAQLEQWPASSRETLRGQLEARERELRRDCS